MQENRVRVLIDRAMASTDLEGLSPEVLKQYKDMFIKVRLSGCCFAG
jgi:hypothetical protein